MGMAGYGGGTSSSAIPVNYPSTAPPSITNILFVIVDQLHCPD
jgi:hypothetical protein